MGIAIREGEITLKFKWVVTCVDMYCRKQLRFLKFGENFLFALENVLKTVIRDNIKEVRRERGRFCREKR